MDSTSLDIDTPVERELAALYELDYSWSALRNWPLPGSGPRGPSLQDYWRKDPQSNIVRTDQQLIDVGELIRAEGHPDYHIVHLPLRYPSNPDGGNSGPPTIKSAFRQEVEKKISEIIIKRSSNLSGNEIQNQQRNLILIRIKRDNFRNGFSKFDDDINSEFWRDVYNVATPKVVGENSKSKPIFLDGGVFSGSELNVQSHGIETNFSLNGCTFYDTFRMSNRVLSADFNINRALFLGPVLFHECIFNSNTDFSHSYLSGSCKFDYCVFDGPIYFSGVSFGGDVNFNFPTFCGYADFSYAIFCKSAHFEFAYFADDLCLKSKFLEAARFSSSTFKKIIECSSQFMGEVDFDRSIHMGIADYSNSKFHKRLQFRQAQFCDVARFRFIEWPCSRNLGSANESAFDVYGAFDGTSFSKFADFYGAGFQAIAAFSGAHFTGGLGFDRPASERDAKVAFRNEIERIKELDDHSLNKIVTEAGLSPSGDVRSAVDNKDVLIRHLEFGSRNIRVEAGKLSEKHLEQFLFSFELLARNHQKSTPLEERILSYIYMISAGYGLSIVKPLIWLAILWVLFAAFYRYILAGYGDQLSIVDYLDISAGRAVLYGAFGKPPEQYMCMLKTYGGVWAVFCFEVMCTIQSIISILLVFLSGLAARRRFQIG